jgi:fructokinase
MREARMRLGLDYGGTKIEGIVLGPEGEERARARVPTPRNDYEGGLRAIRELMLHLEALAGGPVSAVGIGVPGSVDRASGRVALGNSTWLHGRDLRGDLAAVLDRPVKIANDANCFALSEAVDGGGAGAQVVFGIILGTGVGGGLVVHGRLVEGVNAVGGEWGHIPLPTPLDDERPGPVCSCGVAGHTEAWLSGPSHAADYARRAGHAGTDGPRSQEIVALSEGGDGTAEETLRRFDVRLGRSISVIVNVLDPDVIVVGGGLSNVGRLYDNVPPLIQPHVFGEKFNTRLVRNVHGDSSGVRGAAWL